MRPWEWVGALALAVGLLGGARPAAAQTLNIDLGAALPTPYGSPSSAYGAAAGTPGFWNDITSLGTTSNLRGLDGSLTSVQITLAASTINGFKPTPPDNETHLLRADNFYSFAGEHWSIALANLENRAYDVYVYSPTNSAVETRDFSVNGVAVGILDGSSAATLNRGTDWEKVRVLVSDGTLTLASLNTIRNGGVAGLQVVAAEETPAVPEPSSALLFLPALGVMAFLKRRRSA